MRRQTPYAVYAVAILLHPVLRKAYLSNSDEATGNRMCQT